MLKGSGKQRKSLTAEGIADRERRAATAKLRAYLTENGDLDGDYLARKIGVGVTRGWALLGGAVPTLAEQERLANMMRVDGG